MKTQYTSKLTSLALSIGLTILLFSLPQLGITQNKENVQNRLNQLKANKIAFLSQQLQLTPTEAEVFWPVYNEFTEKKEVLNKKVRELAKQVNNSETVLTDAQKEKIADQIITTRVEVANLEMEYHKKFKTVLPISKVLKLYQSENQFKSELVKQLKDQQIKNQGNGQLKRKD